MIRPAVTWAALWTGLVALAGASLPVIFAMAGHQNELVAMFGPKWGHLISAACSFVAAVSLGVTARGRSIDRKTDAGPPKPNPLLNLSIQRAVPPAESSHPIMASWIANILNDFVKPEEHALGKSLAAAYAANKPAVVAALQAQGANAQAILTTEADALITKAFGAVPVYGPMLLPILGPTVDADVNALIAQAIAQAGGEIPVVEAFADKVVATVVADLEAA
jgi:hypothetical protein